MFDPFGDVDTRGYLRNHEGLTELDFVRVQEHLHFTANVEEALDYLSPQQSPAISYATFLEVHRILFSHFYPWAGVDRHSLDVGRYLSKGERVQFERSDLSQRAIEWGLRMAADAKIMRRKPGTVMGSFAWGHPFLDGNGRTMLLVHSELCARAGFAINWLASPKNAYLEALTNELAMPDKGILDNYFEPLICAIPPAADRLDRILSIHGLDGAAGIDLNIAYRGDDPAGPVKYAEMKQRRDASLDRSD
ncbi:cell filamentation protein [Massilia atriviolacea]|uniref:protein adenylyltransferase n=1 Tax=Massilia atriviolacea TaxID=2495579 RepID=A0A430HSJ4_9BURK|nr:Fic family protein [Massilia atriviolacea]RSZ60447.1 cell filamentation protein [Massilia atriviolacea]